MKSVQTHPIRAHPVWKRLATPQADEAPGDDQQKLTAERLQSQRKAYADRIMALAGVAPSPGPASQIAAAFASIPRENFVGPPPWTVFPSGGSIATTSDDPAVLYQDAVVSLGSALGLNNGQPSLHAHCLAELAPGTGESVIHVGAGTGYYTTMLAKLVGESGRVAAYETESDLAQRARHNLVDFPQVAVHCRSGAEAPLPPCDVLYVSASSPEPLAVWLDALLDHGRLLFPLAPIDETGSMLLVTKQSNATFAARFLMSVQFVPCAGTQNAEADRALTAAFRHRNWHKVRSLRRDDHHDGSCWCAGHGWWLSTEP